MPGDNVEIMIGEILAGNKYIGERMDKIEKHLSQINGRMLAHDDDINSLKMTIYGNDSNGGICRKLREVASRQFKLIICVAVLSASAGGGAAKLIDFIPKMAGG